MPRRRKRLDPSPFRLPVDEIRQGFFTDKYFERTREILRADSHSPLAAPIYADLKGLAPLLIQVGAAETLLDDAIRLAKAAGTADVRVDLQIWPEMVHVWHMFHPELKAGKRAIQAGGDYIRAIMAR